MKTLLLAFASVALLAGCAIGPIVSHETARTVGNSNSELVGGYGQAGYLFKWNYGLGKDLDLGLHAESLSIGLRMKYAFINNNSNGWSLAAALGTGESVGGSHYYGDVIASYLMKWWEPYGTVRFVHVHNDPLDFKNKDTGQVDFTVTGPDYDYGEYIVGSRFWLSSHWILSVEAGKFFGISKNADPDHDIFGSGAIGYRF